MKNYTIEVWYRSVVNGEQEKDFERFEIKAKNFEEASNKALEDFKNPSNAIPFAVKNIEL